ncbi:MAG: TIGR04325 family methyltransferase [Thermoflexibacter sp.]
MMNILKRIAHKFNYHHQQDTFWKGNYATWQEAMQHAQGYDAKTSFEQIKAAALKVKNGEAIFERDGKLFHQPEYNWLLLTHLQKIALASANSLNLIDFGGALGSTYFQHLTFLKEIAHLRWNIIEQPHFVAFGKENLSSSHLYFYEDLVPCLKEAKANAILLSGLLSYVAEPYKLLEEIQSLGFKYIIIERTPLITSISDILTIQYVNQMSLYQGSYPAWIFSEEKLKKALQATYDLQGEYASFDTISAQVKGLSPHFNQFKMLFYERKK